MTFHLTGPGETILEQGVAAKLAQDMAGLAAKFGVELKTEEQRIANFKARWIKHRKLKEYAWSDRNILAVLKSGGASLERAKAARSCLDSDLFDHHELWGRDSKPLLIIGHPYTVSPQNASLLAVLAGLGLTADITGAGWYGHGTVQVYVASPDLSKTS